MMGIGERDRGASTLPHRPLGWDAQLRALRVSVHGASGTVGREIVRALLLAGHPPGNLQLFARTPKTLRWHDEALAVRRCGASLGTVELAFLCTPAEVSRRLAGELVDEGTRVIDLSGAFQDDPEVPLVAAGIGTHRVGAFTSLVALPAPSTVLLVQPLRVLEQAAGLERVCVTHLRSLAAGGAGRILAWRQEIAAAGRAGTRGERVLGSYLHPQPRHETGEAACEWDLATELRRLLGRPDLGVLVTTLDLEVERVDGFAIEAGLAQALSPEEAGRLFAGTPGLRVLGAAGPDPLACQGKGEVHVGRIRAGSTGTRSLCCFATGDRLRAGAALMALRVASLLPWA